MDAERALTKETAAANALRESLRALTDDSDALRDTIEGEVNLHEAIVAVMALIRDDEASVLGLGAMVEKLSERKRRLGERIERRRAAIEQAMCIGEIQKIELPDATLFLRKVSPDVIVFDESKIPAAYWKAQDPKLDRSALKAALKDGNEVPGCTLGNGSLGLTIRRA